MSLVEESYLQNLMNQCESLILRQERQAQDTVCQRLDEIYKILKLNTRDSFGSFSHDVIVRFTEISVEIPTKFSLAEEFIQLFFQRVQISSQFYIRALLVQAKIVAYNGHKQNHKGTLIIQVIKEALTLITKALDLISGGQQVEAKGKDPKAPIDPSKAKYSFLVYNASTCVYKITRFMLRPNWQKNFTDIYERIYKLFQEFDEPDHNWRCRFTLLYFQCLYDSDKKPDAFKIIDTLWQKTKNKHCDFQDSLFRLRVHLSKENNALVNIIKKDIEGSDPQGWKILEILQKIKSGIIPEQQVEKQLMSVANQISLGVLSVNEQSSNLAVSAIMQQRLAEAGRVALKFNIINIANSITNFLGKVRQANQKAIILNEYNRAQLEIKKKNDLIDKKTGMMMNTGQIKSLEIQNRQQSLKVLEKVMLINKKFNNPELIYEGAILIWNTSLPFMCPQYQSNIIKCFQISCLLLEQIDCTDHDLRTKMHLQLSKIYITNEQMFGEVEKHIAKALKLDHSIPLSKIVHKFEPEEDPGLYQRPYERYLNDFKIKIMLKTLLSFAPSQLDQVVQDLWNVAEQKSQNTKIDIIQKCLKTLLTLQEKQYVSDELALMIPQEIAQEKIMFQRQKLKDQKRKKLLAAQIAQLAFEWELNEYAKKASDFVLSKNWDVKNSVEMVISQSKCCYFMAQIKMDELTNINFEVPFKDPVLIREEQAPQQIKEDLKIEVEKKKKEVMKYFERGLQLAQISQQHWLVFNGAIYIWNNFLHIFRNPINDSKLHPQLSQLLKLFFEAMKNSLKEIENKQIVYYDINNKIQTFANIGLIYARLMENQKLFDEVSKICEALLLTSLAPHTRKSINTIKARINKGNIVGGKADPKKGSKDPVQQKPGGNNDTFLYEIISQLQIIQNSSIKGETEKQIKKCFENLQNWKPKENDETQIQLHAELWSRLSRICVNQQTILMYKYALRCATYSLSLLTPNIQLSTIPSNRLRWYSLAEFLYSQALLKIVNPETQQVQSCEKLLFAALDHAVDAAIKGFKAGISALILDAAKQVWNVSSRLQHSQANRVRLLSPLKTVLFYVKQAKEHSETDLILLLSQLYFRVANECKQYKSGEEVADMMLSLLPKNLHKSICQAKMAFMSKQGKNELLAISNMKEADPSLQAKLWVKLARASNQSAKQHSSYNQAIQILKKQNSVEIVQVLIQYAEWQLRVGKQTVENVVANLLLASDYLLDIECGEDPEEQVQEDHVTVFSRSTRGKRSQASRVNQKRQDPSKSKKLIEKKIGNTSNKSKTSGANISRMNRLGVVKTVKSKNSKSIFQQKQEDPNPQSLNCMHFEKLFRIHTILSIIASTPKDRIRYALDAKQFIIRIYQLSFKSINDIQENAAKFAENQSNKEVYRKQIVPNTIQQWVKLQLSKECMDKVKTGEDYNFMGVYVFDKPQLTNIYLNHLISILSSYGFDFHLIPLLIFKKFLAKQILANEQLVNISQLQLAYYLLKINYEDKSSFSIQKFTPISAAEQKKEFIKATSQKDGRKDDNQLFHDYSLPKLVKPYTTTDCWLEIAKTIIKFGEVYLSKNYLKEALKNYQVLGNNQKIGQIYLWLGQISDVEGQIKDTIQNIVNANKMCRSSKNLQHLIDISSRVLLKLCRYDDLRNFLKRVYEVVTNFIQQSKNQKQLKNQFQSQVIDLTSVLIKIQIAKIQLVFEEAIQQKVSNNSGPILTHISKLSQRIQSTKIWNYKNYEAFLQVARCIFKHYEDGETEIQFGNQLLKSFIHLLIKIQERMLDLLKYTQIGSSSATCFNSISQLHRECRYVLIDGYVLLHHYGQKRIFQQQYNDKAQELGLNSELMKKYMNTLNEEIYKKTAPIPTYPDPLQTSYSILNDLKKKIDPKSYENVIWISQYVRVSTLKTIEAKQLTEIWKNKKFKSPETQNNKLALENIKHINNFTELENKINDCIQNWHCFRLSQKVYSSIIENRGKDNPEKCFEAIVKYQHSIYSEIVLKAINNYMSQDYKINSVSRLAQLHSVNKNKIRTMIAGQKIYDSLVNFQSYEQSLGLLPRNSLTIIIQLSKDRSCIYFGCICYGRQKEDCKIFCDKRVIQADELKKYLQMKKILLKIKKNLVVSSIENISRQEQIINQSQTEIKKIKDNLEELSLWWVNEIKDLIQKSKQQGNNVIDPSKDKKQPPKDQKKKAGKQDVSGYQSPLGSSPSGIQTVTFLLDSLFYPLPYEELKIFSTIPSVSRDCSLFYLTRKLKEMGFKPQLNNSNGFGMEKGKYISYDFKESSANFKQAIIPEITKFGLKMQGLQSSIRQPSLGDYQKYLSEGGFLQIYGSIDWINHVKFKSYITNISTNKSKLLIITDHLNYPKSFLNKFADVEEEGKCVQIEEEQEILSVLMNLMNVTLIKIRWPSQPSIVLNEITTIYKCLGNGQYIGSINRSKQNKPERMLDRILHYVNGPAVLRM